MKEYNDTYKEDEININGEKLIRLQLEHHILKSRRINLGLTQQQVADRAKIQLRQYQRLESGERSIYGASFRIGLAVVEALELDPKRFSTVTFNK